MLGIGPIDIDRLPEIRRQIERLIQRILEECPASKVILHGSFARGRVHQGSDIDLVVVADFQERFLDRYGDLLYDLYDLAPEREIEALIYTPEELQRLTSRPFIATALREGKVIYESA